MITKEGRFYITNEGVNGKYRLSSNIWPQRPRTTKWKMTAKVLDNNMVYECSVIKLWYDDSHRVAAELVGRMDEHDMWTREYRGTPGVNCVDSRICQPALYVVTDDLRRHRRTRSGLTSPWKLKSFTSYCRFRQVTLREVQNDILITPQFLSKFCLKRFLVNSSTRRSPIRVVKTFKSQNKRKNNAMTEMWGKLWRDET